MGARLDVAGLGRSLQVDPNGGDVDNDGIWLTGPIDTNDLSRNLTADSAAA